MQCAFWDVGVWLRMFYVQELSFVGLHNYIMGNFSEGLQEAVEVEQDVEDAGCHGDGDLPFAGEKVADFPRQEDV